MCSHWDKNQNKIIVELSIIWIWSCKMTIFLSGMFLDSVTQPFLWLFQPPLIMVYRVLIIRISLKNIMKNPSKQESEPKKVGVLGSSNFWPRALQPRSPKSYLGRYVYKHMYVVFSQELIKWPAGSEISENTINRSQHFILFPVY